MNQKLSLIGSIRGGLVFMGRHVLLSALFSFSPMVRFTMLKS